MGKTISLAAMRASKGGGDGPKPPRNGDGDRPQPRQARVNVMVRLTPAQHDVLRTVAFDERRHQSQIIIEALNEWLSKRGKQTLPT